MWAWRHCRISPPHFLAKCCKRQLNQGSFVLLYFRLLAFSDLYWVCLSVFSCTVLFVSISQVIGCEDRLRNDLYCVEWGVKLYSNQAGSWTQTCSECIFPEQVWMTIGHDEQGVYRLGASVLCWIIYLLLHVYWCSHWLWGYDIYFVVRLIWFTIILFLSAYMITATHKNQSGFYWSKRQQVAAASAVPYASLHLAPDSCDCCYLLWMDLREIWSSSPY